MFKFSIWNTLFKYHFVNFGNLAETTIYSSYNQYVKNEVLFLTKCQFYFDVILYCICGLWSYCVIRKWTAEKMYNSSVPLCPKPISNRISPKYSSRSLITLNGCCYILKWYRKCQKKDGESQIWPRPSTPAQARRVRSILFTLLRQINLEVRRLFMSFPWSPVL